MLDFLRSRQWIIARRLVLVAIVVIVAIRQYGGSMVNLLSRPNPTRDIELTRMEFRPEGPGLKPAWIIGFRNMSSRYTYDKIELEATYMDDHRKVLETDKLVVSPDFKSRGNATVGTLRVLGAQSAR